MSLDQSSLHSMSGPPGCFAPVAMDMVEAMLYLERIAWRQTTSSGGVASTTKPGNGYTVVAADKPEWEWGKWGRWGKWGERRTTSTATSATCVTQSYNSDRDYSAAASSLPLRVAR